MPAGWRVCFLNDWSSFCDGRWFSVEVDRYVLVRGDDALVPEPMRDGAEIYPGLEQMNGCTMAHTVRMNAFSRKRRARLCCPEYVPSDDQSRPKSCQRTPAMVTKQYLWLMEINCLVFAVLF